MRSFRVNVNGISYAVEVEEIRGGSAPAAPAAAAAVPIASAPVAPVAAAAAPAASAPAAPVTASVSVSADATKVVAPMPGTILQLLVKPGDSVSEGQNLLILEAMKMENEIKSPTAGQVGAVAVSVGANVNTDDLLIVIE